MTEANATEAKRIRAAKAYAEWHLGDPNWAVAILIAHNNPEDTLRQLREEGWEG